MRMLGKKALCAAAIIGLSSGILLATYHHYAEQYRRQSGSYIIELARPTNPALCYQLRNNPDAPFIIKTIDMELKKYRSDPNFQSGAAQMIRAEHLVAQIFVESGGNPNAKGKRNEIGLMQVSPIHVPDLQKTGILPSADKDLLWEQENNIKAGMFILMKIARETNTIKEALAIYNAGLGKKRFGMAYAQKVCALSGKLEGGEAEW